MDRWYHSLDFLKGFAILGVVLVHTRPFSDYSGPLWYLGLFLVTAASYAVPVFFMTSGFLFRKKLEENESRKYVKKYLEKILSYYSAATLLYLAINVLVLLLSSLEGLEWLRELIILDFSSLGGVLNFLYLGDAVSYHLWFLTALFFSILVVYIFYSFLTVKLLLLFSSLLHIVGILSQGYGLPITVPGNDALFFGLIYTATGFYTAEKNHLKDFSRNKGLLSVFLISVFLSFSERLYMLFSGLGTDVYTLPYSLFIFPMSVSIFLYAVSNPEFGKGSRLQFYGKNSLWIYVVHPVFVVVAAGIPGLLGFLTGVELLDTVVWNLAWAPVALLLTVVSMKLVKDAEVHS